MDDLRSFTRFPFLSLIGVHRHHWAMCGCATVSRCSAPHRRRLCCTLVASAVVAGGGERGTGANETMHEHERRLSSKIKEQAATVSGLSQAGVVSVCTWPLLSLLLPARSSYFTTNATSLWFSASAFAGSRRSSGTSL